MDSAFLQSFLLVVDTGSMSEAARRLGVSPAAVAQQVRALERELGVPLVARAGRSVRPTEAGQRLAEHGRPIVGAVLGLKTLVNDEHVRGELRLGAINTALHSLVPEAMARFMPLHPDVKVLIRSGHSMDLYEAVRRGEVDAAVCLHPPFAVPKTIAWEQLREEPLVVLAHERMGKAEPHALLREQPFLRYDRRLGGGAQADRYLCRNGIVPNERLELSSILAIGMMVERGLGVSLVPDISSALMRPLRLARLPLPAEGEPRRFGVLWERASLRARLIKALLEQARKSVGGARTARPVASARR